MFNQRRFHVRELARLPFLCAALMLALPLMLASPVFARAGTPACPSALHRSQPAHSFMFEIQDFNDTDVLVSNDSGSPAEQLADQVISAWTDSIQPRAEPKDPLSNAQDDADQSDDDSDDASE